MESNLSERVCAPNFAQEEQPMKFTRNTIILPVFGAILLVGTVAFAQKRAGSIRQFGQSRYGV